MRLFQERSDRTPGAVQGPRSGIRCQNEAKRRPLLGHWKSPLEPVPNIVPTDRPGSLFFKTHAPGAFGLSYRIIGIRSTWNLDDL